MLAGRIRRPGTREQRLLLGGERHGGEEVGPALERPPQRGRPPPPGDPGVVADRSTSGTPDPGTPPAGCTAGTRAAGGERLLDARRLVAHDAGHQTRHRVDHDAAAASPPASTKSPDRQLAVAQVVGDPLVDALVAPAQQREPVGGGQLARRRLVEAATRWPRAAATARHGRAASTAAKSGSGPHHHARAAAERRVVDAAVPIGGVLARVVQAHVEATLGRARPSSEASERPVEVLGEDREDVDRARRRSARVRRRADPSGGSTDDHAGRGARPRTSSGPARRRRARAGRCAGFASTAATRPSGRAGAVAHRRRR